MEGIKHRWVWMLIESGRVICEPAAPIPTAIRFAADPLMTRDDWREGLAYLSEAFAKTTRTGDVLERIDRAVVVTARPGLPTRPVQMIDVDDAGGGFSTVCSIGELATISRLNLVIDLHHFAADGGAARVRRLLDDFQNWLINAPDPLPTAPPGPMRKASKPKGGQPEATQPEATLSAPAASQARH